MTQIIEIENGDVREVSVRWSNKYGCPVYATEDGRYYILEAGRYEDDIYFDDLVINVHTSKP
jgi:hypothetical protein